MPYVNVQITRGATREQKAALVRDITDSLVRVLGKKPEHTHIVIQEIDDQNWGFAGILTDQWRAEQKPPHPPTTPAPCNHPPTPTPKKEP